MLPIARPSYDLDEAVKFCSAGLGLELTWRSEGHAKGGRPVLALGWPGASWHLELVLDPASLTQHPPIVEDQLILYVEEPISLAFAHGL